MSIPESSSDWTPRLLEMESELGTIIPDPTEMLAFVCQSIRRELALCRDLTRPLGRFLLAAPNDDVAGALAVGLAGFLFDDERAIVQLNMREYSEKYQVARLVGHPGGLVCGWVEGDLTEPIWHRPQTVVVLSEIESAHPDVWRILVPVLGEGFIVDGCGRKVMFKKTIFIMTTRIGCSQASDMGHCNALERMEKALPREVLRVILPMFVRFSRDEPQGKTNA